MTLPVVEDEEDLTSVRMWFPSHTQLCAACYSRLANWREWAVSAESGWVGTAVGIAVGTLGWVVGLGKVLWPAHPQCALICITAGVSMVSVVILERIDRRSVNRAQV